MATRTISAAGGNWNSTSTWDEGIVPVNGDAVVARVDGTSGNLTVNVASACTSIILTNYVGTLTINALLDVFGTVTLVAGMNVGGTNQLRFNTTATLTSAGKTIPWALLFAGTSQTYTLGDNWTVSGNISCTATTSLTINANQINAQANFTVGAGGVAGTTTIVMAGTGGLSTSTTAIRNNLTINTAGTITIGTLYYNTGTLTYTAGTVNVTAGTTLTCTASTTFNTNGITWVNVTFGGASTITLTSDLTLTGNLTTQTGAVTINGSGRTVTVSGNLTINQTTSGTAAIVLNGTGTWSTTGFNLTNNLTINTTGTITVSGSVRYSTGTLTYITGTVSVAGSSLLIAASTTLDTNSLVWNTISVLTNATLTLNSDFIINGTLVFTVGTLNFAGTGILNILGSLLVGSSADQGSSAIINLPNPIFVNTLTLQGHFISGQPWGSEINNHSITVLGDVDCQNNDGTNTIYPCAGTTTIILKSSNGRILGPTIGNGYAQVTTNLTIDGNYTVTNYFSFATRTLTGRSGSIKHANAASIFFIGTCTLSNINRVIFDRIAINSTATVTTNKFFSGTPQYRTRITASSTTNYTVNFTDGFEKITKFVKISNMTLGSTSRLLILTDKSSNISSGTNIGNIRAINQSPNGISKGDPSTATQTTFLPGGILSDPAFI